MAVTVGKYALTFYTKSKTIATFPLDYQCHAVHFFDTARYILLHIVLVSLQCFQSICRKYFSKIQ